MDCPQQLFLLKIKKKKIICYNQIMNAYNLTCQRYKINVQGSVPVLTPSPGAINTIGHLCILPESRQTLAKRCVFSCCLPQQLSVPFLHPGDCLRFIFSFYSFTVLHWIGGYVDCFQLFAILNKVAVDDLEQYTWASLARGCVVKCNSPVR